MTARHSDPTRQFETHLRASTPFKSAVRLVPALKDRFSRSQSLAACHHSASRPSFRSRRVRSAAVAELLTNHPVKLLGGSLAGIGKKRLADFQLQLKTGCGRLSCRNECALYAIMRSFLVTTTKGLTSSRAPCQLGCCILPSRETATFSR